MSEKAKEYKPHKDTNVVVISGRLTGDPKKRGKTTTFGLAVHEVKNVEGEPVEIPFFIDQVVTYGDEAKKCMKFLECGREVQIVGSLSIGTYELKIDGEVVFYDENEESPVMMKWVEINANTVKFGR